MSRSFWQAKRALTLPLQRRGYGVASSGDRMNTVEEKSVTIAKHGSGLGSGSGSGVGPSAWGPDPVTGYYRPLNQRNEIDPVELREILLNHKVSS